MAVYLADTSALTRSDIRSQVQAIIEPLLMAGRIATCGIVDLELLYSAPDPAAYAELADALQGMPRAAVTNTVVERALEVQALLASRSQHRSVPLYDLLIAACAERNGLTVLHYDADYDRIAAFTGQPTQWVVPGGTVA